MSEIKSQIQQLRENVKTWSAPDGTIFHIHNVQMSDGVQGYALGKSESAPYQVGDDVLYSEVKKTADGLRLRVKKDTGYTPTNNSYSGSNESAKGKNIQRQSALKIAAFMLGSGKSFKEYSDAANKCLEFFKNESQAPQVETRNDSFNPF
tara:strand:- start:3977 stop:4426 length:450 start_codon:yes stop_codon:yes gene_type:complete